ncbi:13710_t:CDS:2 [Entrophospora sp. SA101]|nr:13710_t:CDS:2 [Entrophospora sp. SA101]CAJ0919227.1 2703_t:CDS:2 [Entrophospora sp. SA101]
MERQQEEFKRIQNYRSYSAINPTISDDNKNETKERVGMMRMQRRHSYDIKYYKRELDHQAYPPSPPETIITNNSTSVKSIVRPNILALKPYRCARDDYSNGILLDANENSFGMMNDDNEELNRYPDPNQVMVKERLLKFRNMPTIDYLFLGVGSDEIIDLLMRVFCIPGKDKILITPPTYGMYLITANINDVATVKISKVLKQDKNIKIVFLCSPGNPTGTLLSKDDVKLILEDPNLNGIVVVDEAYIDFVDKSKNASFVDWVKDYPNLFVMQTLSKIGIGNPKIVQLMNNTKAPYNINSLTSKAALNALSDENINKMYKIVKKIKDEQIKIIKSIKEIKGIGKILGSNDANFILVQILDENNKKPSNEKANWLYKELADNHGIVVRYRGNELGCKGCLRITVGTIEDNVTLLKTLKELLG